MDYYYIALATVLLGFAKAGFPNTAALVSVPLIMQVLPANQANGVTLILMMLTDIPAALVHWKNLEHRPLKRVIFPVVFGVIFTSIGWWILLRQGGDGKLTTQIVKQIVGGISILFAIYALMREFYPQQLYLIPWRKISVWGWGLSIGMATAIANASGPLMGLYLFTQDINQKEKFTGTMAWSFFIINWVKFPCMICSGVLTWHEVDLCKNYIIWIPLGIILGRGLLGLVSQKLFNSVIVVVSIVMGIKLLLG